MKDDYRYILFFIVGSAVGLVMISVLLGYNEGKITWFEGIIYVNIVFWIFLISLPLIPKGNKGE